jgi:hypothetical protein
MKSTFVLVIFSSFFIPKIAGYSREFTAIENCSTTPGLVTIERCEIANNKFNLAFVINRGIKRSIVSFESLYQFLMITLALFNSTSSHSTRNPTLTTPNTSRSSIPNPLTGAVYSDPKRTSIQFSRHSWTSSRRNCPII